MTTTEQTVRLRRFAPNPVPVAADVTQRPRARRGERMHHLFEALCDRMGPGHLAVDAGELTLTYAQLDARANELARFLLLRGARPGDRIGLLFDQPVHAYIGMLAACKINAAYVPLDAAFPPDRIAYILQDASVRMTLSCSTVRALVPGLDDLPTEIVHIDASADRIRRMDPRRLTDAERGAPVDDLAYIIYTSGSTGRPKGVAVEHLSICNFVRVAAEVYGFSERDRVYQGLTIAFDFSIEEIWVPWMAGATLVPKPAGAGLLGLDLQEFLVERRVSALCCVPTLLATIEEDLPDLRFLLVSGEACPQDLVARWSRPGRRFLNVYGPTEATVTATWTTVHPDRQVNIGVPLPTYSVVILDPDDPRRALPTGAIGEIGIAGVGLAAGYVNRPDLTAKVFVPDFLGIPDNPSGRIYRTGDLGRVNEEGEIEYHGRIDLQVKIRGYRIELTEIESVLLQVPGIAAAVVDTFEPTPGTVELVGYYSLRADTPALDREAIYAVLRGRLPAYMVPAFLEHLDVIPMTPQNKADRKALPAPGARSSRGPATEHVAPTTDVERVLAVALARTLGLERVSVESHFFDDLGANSLLMAQFTARLRKETGLPAPSIRTIYQHPTIRTLARTVPGGPAPARLPAPTARPVRRAGSVRHALFGTAQLLTFLGFGYLSALVLELGFTWAAAGGSPIEVFVRASAYGAATFVAACVAPIVAKWLLVGRWTPREIRLWGAGHFRFWLVQRLVRANPLARFAGSPVYNLYLRSLGARIGRGVTILSRIVPVATDLLTIGEGTLVRRESSFTCYRAVAGAIQLGPVTVGREVFVGEKTVLDIGSGIGDGGQLGHTSSLHEGQLVPAGGRWHGVPAEPTGTDYRVIGPARCGRLRRFGYGLAQLLRALVLTPAVFGVTLVVLTSIPAVTDVVAPGHATLATPNPYLLAVAFSIVTVFGGLLAGLAAVVAVPRVLHRILEPGRVYPLFGIHYAVARTITALSNRPFFMTLFGDSSAITRYLTAIGYDLSQIQQTGSNFGTALNQDDPLLSTIGTGTMVSDGLSIMNADFSSTSFRVSAVAVGERNFLGNDIAFPAGAKVGPNCLLGTKVMVPIDGPVRRDVGLLGSPCFEIPRSVDRDRQLDDLEPGELRRRLSAKNRHNATSMALLLAVRWLQVLAATLITVVAADLYYLFGALVIAAAAPLSLLSTVLIGVLADRAVLGFRRLSPQFCLILDPYFWRHERLWKLGASPLFAGTPFRPLIWRLLGVRIGRRVFDDGCAIPEKTLVTIGDDAVLNAGSLIQCHSLEDGSFKSDHTVIGAGAVVGVLAFVHYGVTMGAGAVLDADAFLMKGEEVAPHARWGGNPATEVPAYAPMAPARPAAARRVPHHPSPVRRTAGPPAPTAAAVPPDGATRSLPTPFVRSARRGVAQALMPGRSATISQEETMSITATSPSIPLPAPAPRLAITAVPAPVRTTGVPGSPRPRVTTALPGPRSAELLARQAQRESNARVYPRHFPFAVADAAGSYIRDLDDNTFIDFLSGAGVLSLGHNHPELVAAATEQMSVFTHGLDMPSQAKDAFTDAQLSMLPAVMRDRVKIHFCGPTGANAVDAAIKLCKIATGRGSIISFQGGFHGSSHAAMALTGSVSQKRPISNGMPGVHFFPFSSCSRCPLALDPQTCQTNCVSFLERALNDPNGGLELPAAVIMELVQGEGGVIPARYEFVQRVRALTRELGIPLIVDEVQTGCGRTGTWFAFEQYDIEPDIIVASKALSGMGLPVAVILYDEKFDVWAPGAHTGTFRGNQLAFAAGAKAVEIVRREDVLGNVVARGEQIIARLAGLASHPAVLEVRGRGLMWGIELNAPGDGRSVTELAEQVQARALRDGLIVELGGRDDCVVRMLPPLNVTAEVVDIALSILLHAIEGAYVDIATAA